MQDLHDTIIVYGCATGDYIGTAGGAPVNLFGHNLTALSANLHGTIPIG
jgi:hypothetical protein